MTNVYESNIWKFYLFKIVGAIELTISIFVLFLLANNLSMTQVMILQTIFITIVLLLDDMEHGLNVSAKSVKGG